MELFDARWKQRSDAAKLAAEQAVLLLRPQRAPGGAAALPDRSERFQDIMAAARNLAQVGAESAGSFSAAMGGLGGCYFYADGVARDLREARRWLERSAAKGHAQAEDMLAEVAAAEAREGAAR